jgi:U4/U6.U5 tri-snRNP-associated protein 2
MDSLKEISPKCPYLDTINKTILDFDQEKVCSVSLKDNNIYSCLICGKYFHGKGKTTPCYIHSLSEQHHLFINLETRSIYCLPDDYELTDDYIPSEKKSENILFQIKQNLLPEYTKREIKLMDKISANYCTSLGGDLFLPGYLGLGYVKNCQYFNVIIQSLSHLKKFRNFFLEYIRKIDNKDDSIEIFIKKLSEIIKKLWNFSSYKTHIDQRECLQILEKASNKKIFNE